MGVDRVLASTAHGACGHKTLAAQPVPLQAALPHAVPPPAGVWAPQRSMASPGCSESSLLPANPRVQVQPRCPRGGTGWGQGEDGHRQPLLATSAGGRQAGGRAAPLVPHGLLRVATMAQGQKGLGLHPGCRGIWRAWTMEEECVLAEHQLCA